MSGEYESESVRDAINLACSYGNSIDYEWTGWEDARVIVFMKKGMSEKLKEEIKSTFPDLDYWYSRETPHNPPAEGFTSRHEFAKHRESVLFPVGGRHWDMPR